MRHLAFRPHLYGPTLAPDSDATSYAAVLELHPSALVADRSPGDLIAHEEITDADDPNFPTDARAWRVLYVSTGIDNTDLVPVAGVVVAPSDSAQFVSTAPEKSRTGRVVAWDHGTLGLTPRCMPSENPAQLIWGPTPWGIGAVSWGSESTGNLHAGTPENGILAGMISEGWVVAASDYHVDRWNEQPLHPYVVGKIAAANTIDNIRAAHALLQKVFPEHPIARYDVVPWGHSQGGHAAMWTGQLLESYVQATGEPGDPPMSLVGVALEAPGSTFVMRPGAQPGAEIGFGHFDWLAHAQLHLTGLTDPIPVAPFFLSYVFASWAAYSRLGKPDPAQMPAFPSSGPLDIAALVAPDAVQTVNEAAKHCWADGDALAQLTAPYRDTSFLAPEVGDGNTVDGVQHGNFDAAMQNPPSSAIAAWADWITYNLPGPAGTSDLPRVPSQADNLVPVMISAGTSDTVVYCVVPTGSEGTIPNARDCMPVALFDALEAVYSSEEGAHGHLALNVWQFQPGITNADHSDIRGLNATADISEPTFAGSPLHRFIADAFAGRLEAGIHRTLVN